MGRLRRKLQWNYKAAITTTYKTFCLESILQRIHQMQTLTWFTNFVQAVEKDYKFLICLKSAHFKKTVA